MYIFLILVAIIILTFFVSLRLQDYYESKISEKLISNSLLIGDLLKGDLLSKDSEQIQQKIDHLAKRLDSRLTIVDQNGRVLADSEKAAELMENHGDRPEIIRAIQEGIGESNRFSDTLGINMKYVANSVMEGDNIVGIIRIALPLTEVESQIRVIYRIVLLGGIITILIAFIIGYFISRTVARPIAEMKDIAQRIAKGDFTKRIDIKSKDELGILAESFNSMAGELQQKIDNMRNMDNIRTDFVANVSHELKTPLTSIKGFIETLEDGAMDDKINRGRFISIIKKHTERITSIINDLLSLSELELGKDRINKERFSLKNLTDEVVMGFGHALSAKNITLSVNYTGEDFIVNADKLKIEQILVNLIDNAIKYSHNGGKIKVFLSEKKDIFIIGIEDSGIGIPSQHLGRIFERFYRVDKARSRKLGGTGLGLAIVKHIVGLHNGNIDIESQVNQGTKITITIPKGS